MNWETTEEAKLYLLTSAKREAVGELFGEIIKGITQVKSGILKKDEIELVSAGLIRINDNPSFFQGDDFGELCVKIDAYVSDEDIQRLQPRILEKKLIITDLGDARESRPKKLISAGFAASCHDSEIR